MIAAQPNHNLDGSTIAAIATPAGSGGIGIIRISGSEAKPILKRLFRTQSGRELTSHQLSYGWLVDPANDQPLDEVMAVFMQAPKSYTREDVVEIQCHSSYLVLQEILSLVLKAGAVLADPGEFTKRAFLNGRIDLTQAEAVIDLLQAKTSQGMQLALSQLKGSLHDQIADIRDGLIAIRAIIEVAIDFPDDEVEIINPRQMLNNLHTQVIHPLSELIDAAERGKIFREGISVVIMGRPNVGKSSLLNSLLKEERAIVTEIPGTTRDIIEEYLNIKGIPVRIVDTAGIRETVETVEEIGIKKARQKQQTADLVLMVVDSATDLTEEDLALASSIRSQSAILVLNKKDLCIDRDLQPFRDAFPEFSSVSVSAKKHEGLVGLEDAIFTKVTGGSELWDPGHKSVPNVRHMNSLIGALAASRQLEVALGVNLPPDLVAIEVQSALDHLSDIIGETTTDDILDMIFTRFCLGK